MNHAIELSLGTLFAVLVLTPLAVNAFLRNVDAGEIRLVSWLNGTLRVFRGPCKALVVPIFTVSRSIPAQAINVDIEITDQTADTDAAGASAPVKVTVQASAIVSVGEADGMVTTAANKFFSKTELEQLSILTDVLSSAGRRAINLLRHDQLFSVRGGAPVSAEGDDELAVIIKEACSRELLDLGLSFNSLNIKAVLSEVAEARRKESAARAKASADVVMAQEEQRARIAQLEAQEKVNDQERILKSQMAANAAAIARAETERLKEAQVQYQTELEATLLTRARADAAKVRELAKAEGDAMRMKAEALRQSGELYFALRRLELAPAVAAQVAASLKNGKFVNLGSGSSDGAVGTGSADVLKVVQTLLAAKTVT